MRAVAAFRPQACGAPHPRITIACLRPIIVALVLRMLVALLHDVLQTLKHERLSGRVFHLSARQIRRQSCLHL